MSVLPSPMKLLFLLSVVFKYSLALTTPRTRDFSVLVLRHHLNQWKNKPQKHIKDPTTQVLRPRHLTSGLWGNQAQVQSMLISPFTIPVVQRRAPPSAPIRTSQNHAGRRFNETALSVTQEGTFGSEYLKPNSCLRYTSWWHSAFLLSKCSCPWCWILISGGSLHVCDSVCMYSFESAGVQSTSTYRGASETMLSICRVQIALNCTSCVWLTV